MFKKKKNEEPNVNELIQLLQAQIKDLDVTDERYPKLIEQLDKLYKIRAHEAPEKWSKNTFVSAGANILGIVLILGYEQINVVSSKAFGLLTKPRL